MMLSGMLVNDIYLKGNEMEIHGLMKKPSDLNMYTDSIRNILEDHMTFLRNHKETYPITISPSDAYKFEFDLFALLDRYRINRDLWWVVMRLNDMTSPTDYKGDVLILFIPPMSEINKIIQSHRSVNTII